MNWYSKQNVSDVHVSKKTSLSFYVEEAVNKLFSKKCILHSCSKLLKNTYEGVYF